MRSSILIARDLDVGLSRGTSFFRRKTSSPLMLPRSPNRDIRQKSWLINQWIADKRSFASDIAFAEVGEPRPQWGHWVLSSKVLRCLCKVWSSIGICLISYG